MRPMDIRVRPTPADRLVRIVVTGDLDMATIGRLQTQLDAALTLHLGPPVEVDLSAVTFFSCAAAHLLRDAQLRAPESLTVIGAAPPVRRLLEIMQLQPLLDATVPTSTLHHLG